MIAGDDDCGVRGEPPEATIAGSHGRGRAMTRKLSHPSALSFILFR
jgi:hypothetical protein